MTMPPARILTPEDLATVREMRADGIPWAPIARAIKVSETVLLRWATEHLGHIPRTISPKPRPQREPPPPPVLPIPPTIIRSDGTPMRSFHPTSWGAINEPWEDFHARIGLE